MIPPVVKVFQMRESHQKHELELEHEVQSLKAKADGLENLIKSVRTHPVVITSMPKSGTYFFSNLLSRGLAIEKRIVSHQYFPDDTIQFQELKSLVSNGGVSEDHFGPSRVNLSYLAKLAGRVNVHLRDPRQATLSYVHFLSTFKPIEETFEFIYPTLPANYFRISLSEKIDWGIQNWLPILVEWTAQWLEASETQSDLQIRFTHFEDMVNDQKRFVEGVLKFFSIPKERFFHPDIERASAIHFRKGETREYLEIFSSSQLAQANAAIPDYLAQRFNWEK